MDWFVQGIRMNDSTSQDASLKPATLNNTALKPKPPLTAILAL